MRDLRLLQLSLAAAALLALAPLTAGRAAPPAVVLLQLAVLAGAAALARQALGRRHRRLAEQDEELVMLRALVRDVPVAVVALDLDGCVTVWNQAAERVFGWEEREVIGRPLPHVPPAMRDEADQLQHAVRSGRPFHNLSMSRLTKSGTPLHLSVSCTPLRDFGNDVVGVMALYQDPADADAPHAPQPVDVPFRGLVEQSLAGLYIIQDGVFQYVNARYAQMYGYAPQDMIGRAAADFLAESDRAVFHENMRRRISGETSSIRYYLRGQHRDGHIVDMEAHGTRFEYRGRPAVIGIQLDVTERMQFERELKESEARLKAMTANVPGVVYQLMREAGGGIRFSYVSQGILALCGLEPAELLASPRGFIELLPPDDRAGLLLALDRSARELADLNWQVRLRGAAGGIVWVNARARPRRSGEETLWDGLLFNISEAKRQEEEIRTSREQMRELSLYINNVREEQRTKIAREIHDVLGGTLTTLLMDLEWLARQVSAPKAVERAGAMIELAGEAIETVRKISSDLRPGVLDNLGLLAAIEWQCHELRSRMGIECQLSLPACPIQLPEREATAIFRIFQESLTNIVRHAGATRVDVLVGVEDGALEITVEDNGSGISPEQLAHRRSFGIMGMFERAREIGATLQIDGAPGRGTRTVVNFPLTAARSERAIHD